VFVLEGADDNVLHLMLLDSVQLIIRTDQGSTCGSWQCCCLAAASLQIEIKKKTNFEDTVISNVLRDLPFNQNHPLMSADE
jgi:hypothetical protein